jgi:hypothetical protein
MITRNTWILLGLLIVLVGVALFIPWYQGKQPKPTSTAAAGAVAQPVFPSGDIVQFTLKSSDGKSVEVKSAGNNQWTAADAQKLSYDPTTVQSAALFFKSAMVQTELTTQPPAEAMGLNAPLDMITLQMADGSQKVMKIGKSTPTGDGFYAQIDSNPAFTISKSDLQPLLTLLTAGVPPVTPSAAAQGTSSPFSVQTPGPAASPTTP